MICFPKGFFSKGTAKINEFLKLLWKNPDQHENFTKFTDLNDDCKLLILETLDFNSLVNLAGANRASSYLTTDVYRRTFASKQIKIEGPFVDRETPAVESNDLIRIYSFKVVTRLVHNFGSYITKLIIDAVGMKKNQVLEVIALVNRHCDALIELKIVNLDEEVFPSADQQPFSSVKVFSLHSSLMNPVEQRLAMNKMFPKLENLTLQNMKIIDRQNILQTFPNLKHFSVSLMHLEGFVEQDLVQMISLNPQIYSLSISGVSMKLLMFLSEYSPNLRCLSLHWILQNSPYQTHIQFKNVRQLDVKASQDYFSRIVTFDGLEEFNLECFFYVGDIWLSFIRRHASIKKLVISNGQLSENQLRDLIGNIPNLVEATITIARDVDLQLMIQFLNQNPKMQKLDLSFRGIDEIDVSKAFENTIQRNWNVLNTAFGWILHRKIKNT